MNYPEQKPCGEWEWVEELAAMNPDDLSHSARRKLEDHLARCDGCATAYREFRLADSLIRSWPPDEAVPRLSLPPLPPRKARHGQNGTRYQSTDRELVAPLGPPSQRGWDRDPSSYFPALDADKKKGIAGMFCGSCGSQISIIDRHCTVCGAKVPVGAATTGLSAWSPPSSATPPLSSPSARPPTRPQSKKNRRWFFLVAAAVLIISLGSSLVYSTIGRNGLGISTSSPSNGIGVTKAHNGEYIGISDGTFAFDTDRSGGIVKGQGSERLKAGDSSGAQSLWQSALRQDPNDAETLIYLEDQRVLHSGNPYITVVVGTILSGPNGGVGRYNLQGAYIVQKEFNDSSLLPNGLQVRLLIANSGSQKEDATTVAEQIEQVARTDKTIVGVMGWPLSDPTINALNVLSKQNIPMVSSAGSDALTGKIPHFFRISVPARVQASVAVAYAEQTLYAKRAVVFIDPGNAYSNSLAVAFSQQFQADGNTVVTEHYIVGKPATVVSPLQKALQIDPAPDLIYFAGYASDASTLLANLPLSGPFANIAVLGPNALYELEGYQSTARAALPHLRLTAFAYPDEWKALGLEAQEPKFFADYANAFDPNRQHQGSPYGYTRPDADAMLSYDAMLTILSASKIALTDGKQSLTSIELQEALTKITGDLAIQGVSGQISFGSDGNALNKMVLVLCVDTQIRFHLVEARGQFLVGGAVQTLKYPSSSCS